MTAKARGEATVMSIKALRAVGVTKAEIARRVGTDRGSVYAWASGSRTPQPEHWDRLVRFAQASVAGCFGFLEHVACQTGAAPILLPTVSMAARRLVTACEEAERLALELELARAEVRPWYEQGKVGRIAVQWGKPSDEDLAELARPLEGDELLEAVDETARFNVDMAQAAPDADAANLLAAGEAYLQKAKELFRMAQEAVQAPAVDR